MHGDVAGSFMLARRLFTFTFFLLPFSFVSPGCFQPSQLTLRSVQHDVEFSQRFTQAYAGRGEAGEELFVLVADHAERRAAARGRHKSGDPLQPSASAAALRQIVCIKLLWRTLNGTDRTAPTANAAIDWYVLSNSVTGGNDLLQYQGAGMVDVTSKGGGKIVTIRNATVRPQTARGNLTDPVGVSKLLGRFHARNDSAKARELIEATRERTMTRIAETASALSR